MLTAMLSPMLAFLLTVISVSRIFLITRLSMLCITWGASFVAMPLGLMKVKLGACQFPTLIEIGNQTTIFSDKYARIRHENSEHKKSQTKKIQCPHCEKCYSNINALNHHIEAKHKIDSSQKFTCESCREQFPSKTILSDHRKSIHDGPEIESFSFNCTACDQKFKNKQSMLRHKREVHLITSKYLEFADPESFGYRDMF